MEPMARNSKLARLGSRHRPLPSRRPQPSRTGEARQPIAPPDKRAGRKRTKRAPVTPENTPPKRVADFGKQSRHLQPRTAEDIANEQTIEQLALRIWAAMVAAKILNDMAALMDELLESHLLDDDDEEADEGWLDEH